MDTEENMTIDERRKYLRLTQKRYKRATRKGKARLLDEMEAVTGLHRKALIRLLMSDLQREPRRKQRGRKYGVKVQIALKVISESTDYVCAERLQPNLVWFTEHLARHGELEISPGLLDQLEEISIPTVRRILQRVEQDRAIAYSPLRRHVQRNRPRFLVDAIGFIHSRESMICVCPRKWAPNSWVR